MNLLIPSLALALVAIVLLLAIGKILGGHAASREPAADEAAPDSGPIQPPRAGQPIGPPTHSAPSGLEPGLQRELEDLLRSGKVIHAVKRYREEFGVGLKEAKEAIDRLRGTSAPSGATPPSSDPIQDPELRDALAQGKKILAIKRYRELTGASLKESKEAIDAL